MEPRVSLKILRLHHAQITVAPSDEARARDFYCGLLELKEIVKPSSLKSRGGFWLQAGERQVHVGIEDGVNRSATKAHIAYEVDDIAAWKTKLLENDIRPLDSVPIEGYERFEFRDPFGNRVEFIRPIG
ncbi:MAG TPA: VOC family protein [Tepidisphaeraceae bacterium]|nr:VOC family protein [Tepidisphaeraceae bacterium]